LAFEANLRKAARSRAHRSSRKVSWQQEVTTRVNLLPDNRTTEKSYYRGRL
jgi:hypothetical protein